MKVKIAPSVLSADFGHLAQDLSRMERAKADMIHIDVMDGHFVPNITLGPVVVEAIRAATRLPLDVHLMIDDPQDFADVFLAAGSDMITVHAEVMTENQIRKLSRQLKRKKILFGVSLNPNTPIGRIKGVLDAVDFVLVMSVYPGFSGQKFIPAVLPKIKKLRQGFEGDIAVDGGVNDRNAGALIRAGATVLVTGSYLFGSKDARCAMEGLRNAK
jgi:ribulose-phosphate 3-epimerase